MTILSVALFLALAWKLYREWTPSAALWCGIGAAASLFHHTTEAF